MSIWDDLLQQGGDLLDDGKRVVGEVVDAGTDALGGVLDAVGADGMADAVREFGDSVADQLGATPDEMALGESEDPKDLIHGEPGQMRDRAGKLDGLAGNFEAGANGLRGISVGEFSGEAADAYHQKISEEAPKWDTAADACRKGSGALNGFAPIVEAAQQRAAEAIAKWKEGIRQHEEYVKQVDAYNSAVDSKADVLPPRPPAEDPGRKLQNEAVEILNDARRSRNDGAATAASAFRDAANDAPPMPPATQRLAADVNDFKGAADMFTSHAAVGLVGAVTDLGRLVRTVDPTNPYNIAHPADYLTNASAVAAGLTNMAAHPDELVKGFIGDGWASDPGQATGTLLANLIPIGPKGSGIAKSILKDAMEGGGRTALRDGAESALRQAPELHPARPEAPSASPSPHGGTPDAAPAARTHETAAPPQEHAPAPSEPRAVEPRSEAAPEPDAPRAPEPQAETPRGSDGSPAERPEPHADQPTTVDNSPGPEPRPDPPSVDRTPEPTGGHSTHSDSTPDSSAPHGNSHESPSKDPDGPGPGPRDELPPKDAPPVREPDAEGRPTDADTPPVRDHTDAPVRDETPPARPGEHAPAHTEPARAPASEAPPVKPDAPDVRSEAPASPRADAGSSPTAPHGPAPASAPASPSPVTPGRVEAPTPHTTPKADAPQAVRDAPAPREAPRAEAADARAKPSSTATAEAPSRPAAGPQDKSAPSPAQQVEPAAVLDTRPLGQPGGGDRVMPSRADGAGGHERSGRSDPVHSEEPTGRGWERLTDEPVTSKDPSNPWSFADDPADPERINPEVAKLMEDPAAPLGRNAAGEPYSASDYAEQFNKLGPEGQQWVNFPDNGGAVAGTKVAYDDFEQFVSDYGDRLDRIGDDNGRYLGLMVDAQPASWGERALHAASLREPYNSYTFGHLPDQWRIEISEVAPGLGQPGGGIQVRIMDSEGGFRSVDELVKKYGVLER